MRSLAHLAICSAAAVAALALSAAPAAAAPVYNAGADMLANEEPDGAEANPNGPWSYVTRTITSGTTLNLFTTQASIGAFEGWQDPNSQCCGALPNVVVNTGAPTGSPDGTVATGEITMHPDGSTAGNFAGEEKAVVRFTAPAAGQYSISALFEDVDDCCGQNSPSPGVDVHVVVNGTSVFDAAIARETEPGLPASTSYSTPSVTLAAGDVVDFVVGTNGHLFGDNTRFNATIELIPEPASLALVAIGLLAGGRRRR